MPETRNDPRVAARFGDFTRSTFRGRFQQLKYAAATTIAAFFVAAAQPAGAILPAGAAQPGPALWIVQDSDTTIFLFGTFHALDERTEWFDRSVQAAFNLSDQLVLETIVPDDPAELHSVLVRNSLANEPKVGEPVVAPGRSQSFVASAGQAMSAGRTIGMTVDNGADAVLRRAANASGKPVEGLESFEFQLRMFGNLPPPKGQSPHGGNIQIAVGDMQAAWKRGDDGRFTAILGNVRAQSPVAYKMLFTDRNANWAGWIANRMTQPGTVFVAVGTGHLVGPDSVQRYLAARGISSARIS